MCVLIYVFVYVCGSVCNAYVFVGAAHLRACMWECVPKESLTNVCSKIITH